MRGVWKDAAIGTPLTVATGAVRAYVANRANPDTAAAPVARQAWVTDAITFGVGAVGLLAGALTGQPSYYEATEGVLFVGLANLAEDATHDLLRKDAKATSSTPASTFRAQVQSADLTPAPVAKSAVVTPIRRRGFAA